MVALTNFLEGLWLCDINSLAKKKMPVPVSVLFNVSVLTCLFRTFQYLAIEESIEQLDSQHKLTSPTIDTPDSDSNAKRFSNPFIKGNILKLGENIEIRSKDKHISENHRLNFTQDANACIRLYVQLVDLEHELPHTRICDICKSDLLNRFFHCSECSVPPAVPTSLSNCQDFQGKFSPRLDGIDLCFECYGRGRFCKHPIMTLMQTFDSIDRLDELSRRANICIKNWASKASFYGTLGVLSSMAEDKATIDLHLANMGTISTSDKKSSGTIAFGILLERANNLISFTHRPFASLPFQSPSITCINCQKRTDSGAEVFISCNICGSKCCHECIWNLLAIDPFDAIKENSFICISCSPRNISSYELSCKKMQAVLPWIGCVSSTGLNENAKTSQESFISSCFFDTIVAEATRKISLKLGKGTPDYKVILLSHFKRVSGTCLLKSSSWCENPKQDAASEKLDPSKSGNSERFPESKILKLDRHNDVINTKDRDDFGKHLSATVDLEFGLAIKSLVRKKWLQKKCIKKDKSFISHESSGQTQVCLNVEPPLDSNIPNLKVPSCQSKIQMQSNHALKDQSKGESINTKKIMPRSSIPSTEFLECPSTHRS